MYQAPNVVSITYFIYIIFTYCYHSVNVISYGLAQGWPTFLASGPNFRYISVGGPKISSKRFGGPKKKYFLSFI
jgi:hypothetical protein